MSSRKRLVSSVWQLCKRLSEIAVATGHASDLDCQVLVDQLRCSTQGSSNPLAKIASGGAVKLPSIV